MYDMTPSEFEVIEKAYREKQKQDEEERVTLAYMTALWTAQWFGKKRPKGLNEILGRKPKQKEMTAEQMYQMVKLLNTAFGGD